MTFAKLKPWLLLALIFVAGGVTGACLTVALGRHFDRPPGPDQIKSLMQMRLVSRLGLTPDQQVKVKPILEEAAFRIQGVHRDELGQMKQIIEEMNRKIAPLLTPEQLAQLRDIQKDDQRRFSGRMMPWGGPNDPGPRGRRPWADRFGGGGPHPGKDGGDMPAPPPPSPEPTPNKP